MSTGELNAEDKNAGPSLFYQCLAELFGTCFIVILGVNAVHGAVLAGGAQGNFQVGMMFALGIAFGVYTAGSVRETPSVPMSVSNPDC